MTKDRDYWRGENNDRLIEETKRGVNVDWQELAVVLAERLRAEEQKHWGED